jgi:hypothetical protein
MGASECAQLVSNFMKETEDLYTSYKENLK